MWQPTMAADAVTGFAPAKINLTLHVTGKRPDGYHLLESLVVFAQDVGDQISVTPSADLTLVVDGPMADNVPTDGSNLVLHAAQRLRDLRGVSDGAAIHLTKHLPHGAGIGGGSADAAAALGALATLWDVPVLTGAEALPLGADLPVCLAGPTPQIMSGIGDQVVPAPALPPAWLVLVNPGVHVPTGDVFDLLSQMSGTDGPAMESLPDPLDMDDFAMWLLEQRNDLAQPAAEFAPEIARILSEFWANEDYVDADMSGSGSTCWGLFESPQDAENAAAALRAELPNYWVQVTAIS